MSMRRRELLAAIGMGAVAGCGSTQTENAPDELRSQTQPPGGAQADCVDRAEYEQLRDQYQDLGRQYENLREQYIELQDRVRYAKLPPYITADRRFVSVTYESLEGEVRSWEWNSDTLSAQFTSGFFIRELTYAQLEYIGWNQFGFEGRTKYTELGNHGLYYQLNPFVIPSNFQPMAEELHRRYRTDQRRIEAAWHFTNQLNEYVSEIEETPRFPLETLLMGGGDCEDSAILLGSILYAMPVDYNTAFWYIDADYPTDPQQINHVVLSVELDDGPMIIETTSDRMRPWESINGFRVPIEPGQAFNS